MPDIESNGQDTTRRVIERDETTSDYDYSDEEDDESISNTGTWLRYTGTYGLISRRLLLSKRRLARKSHIVLFICLALFLSVQFIRELTSNGATKENEESEVGIIADNEIEESSNEFISQTKISSKIDSPFQIGCRLPALNEPRANAAFVVLARNSEVKAVIKSMKSMERHFNQWFNYPWAFLNDEAFSEEFKNAVQKHTSSKVEFGKIPTKEWNFSEKVDPEEVREHIAGQSDRRVLYGYSESYHKMCRFFSGYFYKHELVKKRDWYWRVEPDVEFFCDLTYDPFVEMEKHNKKYGFTVLIDELYYTIPGLFKETRSFIRNNYIQVGNAWNLFIKNYKYVQGENAAEYDGLKTKSEILQAIEINITLKRFLSLKDKTDDHIAEYKPEFIRELFEKSKQKPRLYEDRIDLEEYNLCHFWSNFEIARTDLFNSPEYEAYFNHLEDSGGFYKERWGDAPVHSLAVGMMLDLEEIHYFRDIGYQHSTLSHCPGNSRRFQVKYEPSENYNQKSSNKDKLWFSPDGPSPNGVGCRCRCPKKTKEIEDSSSSCIRFWADITSDSYMRPKPVDIDFWESEIEKRLDKFLAAGGKLGENKIVEELLA